MDKDTGAAGYMMSGDIAGGSTSLTVNFAYLVDIGFSIVDLVQSILLIISAVLAIAGVAFLVIGIACFLLALYSYGHSIALMGKYLAGDEEAGQELVNDMWINIGVTIGLSAIRAIAKPIISNVLKSKLVKEFGEEVVERLAKTADDLIRLGKANTGLKKMGLGRALINEASERFGLEGLEWIAGKKSLGLSADIWEQLIKADGLMSYSDDLLKAIKNSKGYVKDIIRQVAEYGDDAAQAIIKCGDDAVVIIGTYGEDVIGFINKYGDDAVDVIYKYEDEAVDGLKNGIKPDEIEAIKSSNCFGFTVTEVYNLKTTVISEGQALKDMGLTNDQLGPAIAGAYDKSTGKIYTAINDYDGKIPSELAPIIKERIEDMPQEVYESYALYTKGAGSHAEIYAVNKLLLDNPNVQLSDIAVYVNRTLGVSKPVFEVPFETCPHCRYILEGFNILSNQ